MPNISNNRNDYAIYTVETRMPVDQLIMILYENPSPQVFKHFKFVNQHTTDGIVRPGQIILISPANAMSCTTEEAMFQEAARQVDKKLAMMSTHERKLLAKHYEFLSNVASYNGLLLGIANTSWNAHVKQVKGILVDIEKAYVKTYNTTGKLNNPAFFKLRNMKFQQLNTALSRFIQPRLGGTLLPGDIRRNLGLSSKSAIHQWKKMGGNATSIPNFTNNYDRIAKMATNLKRVGYVGIALDGFQSYANIQQACTIKPGSDHCGRTKYRETGRFGGSIAGGGIGGFMASYATCNLLFGLETAGTSLLWCSIVAGAAGGYFGAKHGGQFVANKAELLYDYP